MVTPEKTEWLWGPLWPKVAQLFCGQASRPSMPLVPFAPMAALPHLPIYPQALAFQRVLGGLSRPCHCPWLLWSSAAPGWGGSLWGAVRCDQLCSCQPSAVAVPAQRNNKKNGRCWFFRAPPNVCTCAASCSVRLCTSVSWCHGRRLAGTPHVVCSDLLEKNSSRSHLSSVSRFLRPGQLSPQTLPRVLLQKTLRSGRLRLVPDKSEGKQTL